MTTITSCRCVASNALDTVPGSHDCAAMRTGSRSDSVGGSAAGRPMLNVARDTSRRARVFTGPVAGSLQERGQGKACAGQDASHTLARAVDLLGCGG